MKAVEDFRYQLLCRLHYRDCYLNHADKSSWLAFQQSFRITSPQEPILFEHPATFSGRPGIIYLTNTHIYYSSAYTLILEPIQKVLVLKTIRSISIPVPSQHTMLSLTNAQTVELIDEGMHIV